MSSQRPGAEGVDAGTRRVQKAKRGGAGSTGVDRDAQESEREAAAVAYLSEHPDFFERHPAVLAGLRVPHKTGGAVSLIEYQVNVLRRDLETERSRFSHLISRAREYESLSNRLHGLVLKLIPARDLNELGSSLTEALCRELRADAVSLKLFPLGADGQSDPLALAFGDFLERDHALCGPLDDEKAAQLFGEAGESVRSAALIPIRSEGHGGVLAIGATDPERFRPDMGTDLLDRLGEIVGCKLQALSTPPPKGSVKRPAKPRSTRKRKARQSGASAPEPASQADGSNPLTVR